MPREFARWNMAAHNDPEWRSLPWPAQWLYKALWDHPRLSYCGVVEWRPSRLSVVAAGLSEDLVRLGAQCLEARKFIVTDEITEELLIRSWARFDGLMRQPRMAVSFARALNAVESADITGVLVYEAQKIQRLEGDLAGWAHKEVAAVLAREPIDPHERDLPTDPFADGFHLGLGPVCSAFGPNAEQHLPPASNTPTPSPSPSPSLHAVPASNEDNETSSRRKPERPLPASWEPNAKHYELAIEKGIDIREAVTAFRNHADTNDRRARNWDAAFRTWLTRAKTEPKPAASFWDNRVGGGQ